MRRWSGEEQHLGTEAEVKGDGDMYLEETYLDLGRLGMRPLSFSEGKSGGLVGFRRWVWWVWEEALGFGGLVKAASEMTTIIISISHIPTSPLHPQQHSYNQTQNPEKVIAEKTWKNKIKKSQKKRKPLNGFGWHSTLSKYSKTPGFHVGFEYWRQTKSKWRVVEICVECEKAERRE